MDIETFNNLANKEHGLVPMLIVSDEFVPYQKDGIAGFYPDTALDLFQKGVAIPVDSDGKVIPVKAAPPAAAVPNAKTGDGAKLVEIPDDWSSLHHLKRVRLAKDISGSDVTKADEADKIIAAEVERRAQAPDTPAA